MFLIVLHTVFDILPFKLLHIEMSMELFRYPNILGVSEIDLIY